jgi:hypothetical protein
VLGIALGAQFQVMPDGLLHRVLFAARCVSVVVRGALRLACFARP